MPSRSPTSVAGEMAQEDVARRRRLVGRHGLSPNGPNGPNGCAIGVWGREEPQRRSGKARKEVSITNEMTTMHHNIQFHVIWCCICLQSLQVVEHVRAKNLWFRNSAHERLQEQLDLCHQGPPLFLLSQPCKMRCLGTALLFWTVTAPEDDWWYWCLILLSWGLAICEMVKQVS